MLPAAPEREQVRRLAELREERPVVLSLYLDLDPREFATPPARATAVRSLLDDAERALGAREDLSHQDRAGVQEALGRVKRFMERDLPSDGAQGVAVFASGASGLFETVSLPRPVPSRVAIENSPLVGPLAAAERSERWAVMLVNRQDARLFRGSADGLREVARVHDDVHGKHDQGGLSQARYQRSVDKEASDHLRHTAERLFRHFQGVPFDHLLVGGPTEAVSEFEGVLHGWLRERLAGRIEVEVTNATPEEVLEAAHAGFELVDERREEEALARLAEGSRATSGLENVLRPLNERRVEKLLIDDGFEAAGALCPKCGLLASGDTTECPADGTSLEPVDDVGERAVELALAQDAHVLPVRRRADELNARGGIAVLTRF